MLDHLKWPDHNKFLGFGTHYITSFVIFKLILFHYMQLTFDILRRTNWINKKQHRENST